MTQKSAARRARDEYRKNNTAWSDIDQLYQANVALLNTVSQQVADFFAIEGVGAFLPADHRATTVSAIRTLDADVKAFKEDLNKIHATHANRSGPLKPDEDIVDVIRLSEAYISMETQINSVVTPIYHYLLSIMEQVTNKAAALSQENAAAVPETTAAPV